MHPHLILHILKAGGVPAAIGAIAGGILAFPQATTETGAYGVQTTTYHSTLGGSGLELAGAVELMIGWIIIFALGGIVLGGILVALGLVRKDDLGGEI